MGKPHPLELRQRVVAFVDEGNGHREAARHFRTSPKFVNDMIKLRRETGGLDPKPQGNGGGYGKLSNQAGWVRARLAEKGDLTLDELRLELEQVHGVTVHRASVGGWLHRLGLSHKKNSARRRAAAARRRAGAQFLDQHAPTVHAQGIGTAGV